MTQLNRRFTLPTCCLSSSAPLSDDATAENETEEHEFQIRVNTVAVPSRCVIMCARPLYLVRDTARGSHAYVYLRVKSRVLELGARKTPRKLRTMESLSLSLLYVRWRALAIVL